ncbi:hypothetical protein RB195_009966 [Necator americanus]|uniref:Uncharacterized protein n=1 Tax=Necator americanus TaxID=51031 RepID=A0ABR1CVS4_NECAM
MDPFILAPIHSVDGSANERALIIDCNCAGGCSLDGSFAISSWIAEISHFDPTVCKHFMQVFRSHYRAKASNCTRPKRVPEPQRLRIPVIRVAISQMDCLTFVVLKFQQVRPLRGHTKGSDCRGLKEGGGNRREPITVPPRAESYKMDWLFPCNFALQLSTFILVVEARKMNFKVT